MKGYKFILHMGWISLYTNNLYKSAQNCFWIRNILFSICVVRVLIETEYILLNKHSWMGLIKPKFVIYKDIFTIFLDDFCSYIFIFYVKGTILFNIFHVNFISTGIF